MNKTILIAILISALLISTAAAHKPYIIGKTKNDIMVTQPEISKAYYGELNGDNVIYAICSDEPFELYVNILAPDPSPETEPQGSDLSIWITNNDDFNIKLKGENHNWTQFYEEYGKDHYLKGPEYKTSVLAGTYYVTVYSKTNSEKYALAIGEKEDFNLFTYISAFLKAIYLDWWFFK